MRPPAEPAWGLFFKCEDFKFVSYFFYGLYLNHVYAYVYSQIIFPYIYYVQVDSFIKPTNIGFIYHKVVRKNQVYKLYVGWEKMNKESK